MEEKRYQVFVSSTFEDLTKAREKIIETILRLYHFPVGMEMFSADNDEQWDVIKDTIDISDFYIVIIGHRYGSETSDGISYTEKEYDYAKEKNIPILAFIQQRSVATKPHEREDDSTKTQKLEKFIEKATKSKMCEFWESVDDLSTKVAIALPKIFLKYSRIGWVRADKAITPEISLEFAKLSKENRELRQEIEELQARLKNKKPILTLQFNGRENIELTYINAENIEIPFGNEKIPIPVLETKEPLTQDDVPNHLKSYISNADIEKYNNELPTEKMVNECNRKLELYARIKETNCELLLSICNHGNIKASEIFIDVEFPPEVLIFENAEIENYDFPDIPFPENPIPKAEEKHKKKIAGPFSAMDFLLDRYSSGMPHIPTIPEGMVGLIKDQENRISISTNKISIRLKSLLHTRTIDFDDIAIIPLKTGSYKVRLSIICEEYEKEEIKIIPLLINDEPANN